MTREQAKPQISMSLTPIVGVPWVNTLRADGQARKAGVYHARFDTRDNPGADPEFIAGVHGGNQPTHLEYADSLPLAIVHAALAAVEKGKGK